MIYDMNKLTVEGFEGVIYLGRAPGYGSDRHEDFREIRSYGISKIYCLQEEDELLYLSNGMENIGQRRESLSALGIELVHSPVRDFGVPSIEQAEELTKMILSDVTEGKNILIHCMGGLGRTGTIAASVLVRTGISPDDAVMAVRSVRPGTLETDKQVGFVRKSVMFRSPPVIMIHGFVGSPFDYKPLADSLSNYDYDMIIPVIPGQVRTSPIMGRGDFSDEFYIDWLDSIISETTKRYGRKPHLIGFSMGGAMSSCVAEKDRIEKLVMISPYFSLPKMNDMISDTAKGLKYILPAVPKFQKGKINDPEGYKRYKPGSDMISVKAFTELQKLAKRGYEKAKKLDMPVLILASENDQVASFDKVKEAAAANPNIKLIKYTKSNHIILYDYDRDDAIEKILGFLESNDNKLNE